MFEHSKWTRSSGGILALALFGGTLFAAELGSRAHSPHIDRLELGKPRRTIAATTEAIFQFRAPRDDAYVFTARNYYQVISLDILNPGDGEVLSKRARGQFHFSEATLAMSKGQEVDVRVWLESDLDPLNVEVGVWRSTDDYRTPVKEILKQVRKAAKQGAWSGEITDVEWPWRLNRTYVREQLDPAYLFAAYEARLNHPSPSRMLAYYLEFLLVLGDDQRIEQAFKGSRAKPGQDFYGDILFHRALFELKRGRIDEGVRSLEEATQHSSYGWMNWRKIFLPHLLELGLGALAVEHLAKVNATTPAVGLASDYASARGYEIAVEKGTENLLMDAEALVQAGLIDEATDLVDAYLGKRIAANRMKESEAGRSGLIAGALKEITPIPTRYLNLLLNRGLVEEAHDAHSRMMETGREGDLKATLVEPLKGLFEASGGPIGGRLEALRREIYSGALKEWTRGGSGKDMPAEFADDYELLAFYESHFGGRTTSSEKAQPHGALDEKSLGGFVDMHALYGSHEVALRMQRVLYRYARRDHWMSRPRDVGHARFRLAALERLSGDLDSALESVEGLLEMAKAGEDFAPREVASCHELKGDCLLDSGEADRAGSEYSRAIREAGNPELLRASIVKWRRELKRALCEARRGLGSTAAESAAEAVEKFEAEVAGRWGTLLAGDYPHFSTGREVFNAVMEEVAEEDATFNSKQLYQAYGVIRILDREWSRQAAWRPESEDDATERDEFLLEEAVITVLDVVGGGQNSSKVGKKISSMAKKNEKVAASAGRWAEGKAALARAADTPGDGPFVDLVITPGAVLAWRFEPEERQPTLTRVGALEEVLKECEEALASLQGAEGARAPESSLFTALIFEEPEGVTPSPVYLHAPGFLSRFPFEALRGPEGRHLVEDSPIVYWSPSSSEGGSRPASSGFDCVVVGGVDYGEGVVREKGERASWGLVGNDFSPLPGSELEAEVVGEYLGRFEPEPEVLLLEGEGASEEALTGSLEGCHLLHLATHAQLGREGWSFAQEARDSRTPLSLKMDPLAPLYVGMISTDRCAGIALAGANSGGGDSDDGFLDAQEIQALDLSACRIAFLSTCESGVSVSGNGIALISLSSAFHDAGSEFVIWTRAKVDDKSAASFATAFYGALVSTDFDPATAFRQAQLEMISENRGSDDPAERISWSAFGISHRGD
ncbi:MAG: CHAT domain-containing protein [Planctomycetota bacterium]|nr:CHAT domain-containing protein [Planctomycetota bacterium]